MCFSELAFAAVVFIALIIAAVILCIGVAFIRRFHLSLAFFWYIQPEPCLFLDNFFSHFFDIEKNSFSLISQKFHPMGNHSMFIPYLDQGCSKRFGKAFWLVVAKVCTLWVLSGFENESVCDRDAVYCVDTVSGQRRWSPAAAWSYTLPAPTTSPPITPSSPRPTTSSVTVPVTRRPSPAPRCRPTSTSHRHPTTTRTFR